MTPRTLFRLAMLVVWVLGASCRSDPGGLAGKYGASDPGGTGATVLLELRNDGRGSWRMGSDDFSFTWEVRGDELWLHTKSGGVIAGKVRSDHSIRISLPEVGAFHFQKTGP